MKQFKIFAGSSIKSLDAYEDGEKAANAWLKDNQNASIIGWKPCLVATNDLSEFALCLLIEQPEGQEEVKISGMRKYQLNSDHYWQELSTIAELGETIEEHKIDYFTIHVVDSGEVTGTGTYTRSKENKDAPFGYDAQEDGTAIGLGHCIDEIIYEELGKTSYEFCAGTNFEDVEPATSLEELARFFSTMAVGEKCSIFIFRGVEPTGEAQYKKINWGEWEIEFEKEAAQGLLEKINEQ